MIKFGYILLVLLSWFRKKERHNWNWLRFKTWTCVKLEFYQPPRCLRLPSHCSSVATSSSTAPWRRRRRPRKEVTAAVWICPPGAPCKSTCDYDVDLRLRDPHVLGHERGCGDGKRRRRRQRGWAEQPLQGEVAARVAVAALHRWRRAAAAVPADGRDGARSRICSLRLEKAARQGRRRQPIGAGEGS
jgi:hypothetical protein